jgi:hypothetical protein
VNQVLHSAYSILKSLSAEQDLRKNFICTFHGFTFTSINIREKERERFILNERVNRKWTLLHKT